MHSGNSAVKLEDIGSVMRTADNSNLKLRLRLTMLIITY